VGYPTKIMTCCYCGTRAALVLKEQGRHELSCGSCAAPLHDLKMLPKARVQDAQTIRSSAFRTAAEANYSTIKARSRKGKRRKGVLHWMLDEAWDTLEDVFEDIADEIFD